MAGLEGIDASSMELVDALGARFVYDEEEHVAKPLLRHADFVPVALHRDGGRVIDRVRFGMLAGGRLITNARDDRLSEARSWKALFGEADHHCLTAISYVVERAGKDPGGGIQAGTTFRIQRRDGRPMVVPGLTAVRHLSFSSTGNEYDDPCHVQITAPANAFVSTIHDRFVVDLATVDERDAWMAADAEACRGLLRPAPDDAYEMVPISGEVWKRRKDPDVVRPKGEPLVWEDIQGKGQRTLF